MSDERVRGAEQFAADAGDGYERAHQQEHRNDAEGIVGDRAHGGLANQLHRRPKAGETTKPGDADEPHRHADRHAQKHQRKQADEADDRDDLAVHPATPLSLSWRREYPRDENEPIGSDRDQQDRRGVTRPCDQ